MTDCRERLTCRPESSLRFSYDHRTDSSWKPEQDIHEFYRGHRLHWFDFARDPTWPGVLVHLKCKPGRHHFRATAEKLLG